MLENFVEKYPQSPYYIPALLDLGLVYLNLGDSDKSLHFYDKIITSMPQSAAAKDAMQSVRLLSEALTGLGISLFPWLVWFLTIVWPFWENRVCAITIVILRAALGSMQLDM